MTHANASMGCHLSGIQKLQFVIFFTIFILVLYYVLGIVWISMP